jgi:glycosyltransferase involved in cell wall biosynthesis
MNEKEKYLKIYSGQSVKKSQVDIIPGKMGGGYGRICWGENMLETLKCWKVTSLLDVGCGYGNFCDAASLFVPDVYGLDIASVAAGQVIQNPMINYLDGEAKKIELPKDAVEWVTSFDCLEHCLEENIDQILSEFNRVSTKGFVLSISYEPCEMDGMPLHMTVKPESWWIRKLNAYGDVEKLGRTPITGVPYLICRKPIQKRVICYCAGTLGTRLRALCCAESYARRTHRHLAMVWSSKDPLCMAKFSSLFSDSIPIIAEDGILGLGSCKIYAKVKEVADHALVSGGENLKKAVLKWGCTDPKFMAIDDKEDNVIFYTPSIAIDKEVDAAFQFIRHLSPAPYIRDRVESIISRLNLGKHVMGVFARGTDFGIEVEAYAQQMKRAIAQSPNQKFLVISDDASYERHLCQRFRKNVLIRKNKHRWNWKIDDTQAWTIDNVLTTEASVTEAVIDLYLIKQTEFRIYHESSAYAQMGAILSAVNPMGTVSPIPPESMAQTDTQHKAVSYRHSEATGIAPPAHPKSISRSEADIVIENSCTIYYLCPDLQVPSAGIRRLYRHAALLSQNGFDAFILHENNGFQLPDMPAVPIKYMAQISLDKDAIFVIPEGMPKYMHELKDHPGRRFVIALNWHYVFNSLPDGVDWRQFNIERAIVISPMIGQMISWSMGIPAHVLASGINPRQYRVDSASKQLRIAFITRKAAQVDHLKRLLGARNPEFIRNFEWMGLHGLQESEYASRIRESALFLNLSTAEGFPTSCLEAMASGTLVAGYDGVGGRDLLRGHGPDQNCILAPMGDYVSLAYYLEPVLTALLNGRFARWKPILSNALITARRATPESEMNSLIMFWRSICADSYPEAA